MENLFSRVRRKIPTLRAIDVKNILWPISIAKVLEEVPKSNYDYDGDEFLIDLLDPPAKSKRSAMQKKKLSLKTLLWMNS